MVSTMTQQPPAYVVTCVKDSVDLETKAHVEKVLGSKVAWLEYDATRALGQSPRVETLYQPPTWEPALGGVIENSTHSN